MSVANLVIMTMLTVSLFQIILVKSAEDQSNSSGWACRVCSFFHWISAYSEPLLMFLSDLQSDTHGSRCAYLPTPSSAPGRSVKAPYFQSRSARRHSPSDADPSDQRIFGLDPSVRYPLSTDWQGIQH